MQRQAASAPATAVRDRPGAEPARGRARGARPKSGGVHLRPSTTVGPSSLLASAGRRPFPEIYNPRVVERPPILFDAIPILAPLRPDDRAALSPLCELHA